MYEKKFFFSFFSLPVLYKLYKTESEKFTLVFFLFVQEDLTSIIENKNEAETLYSVLHIKTQPPSSGKEDKLFAKKRFISKFRNKK